MQIHIHSPPYGVRTTVARFPACSCTQLRSTEYLVLSTPSRGCCTCTCTSTPSPTRPPRLQSSVPLELASTCSAGWKPHDCDCDCASTLNLPALHYSYCSSISPINVAPLYHKVILAVALLLHLPPQIPPLVTYHHIFPHESRSLIRPMRIGALDLIPLDHHPESRHRSCSDLPPL